MTDKLFPKGRYGRRIVHLSFRLINPYRWPTSLAHYLCVELPSQAFNWTLEHAPTPVAAGLTGAAARATHLMRGITRGQGDAKRARQ